MIRLAFYNLIYKKLSSLLSWLSLSLSVCIISVLLMLQYSYEKQLLHSIEGIDMVLGAKGSPLQLILSSVFHIDAPTGNIPYKEARRWMHHPYVAKAIPLAYGDSYKGKSIVGSDASLWQHYHATIHKGRIFTKDFEVIIGSNIEKSLQLKLGSQFYSTHGNEEHGEEHKDHRYTVVGVLGSTGTIIDNLLVSNIESVWEIHDHGGHDHKHEETDHAREHHTNHASACNHGTATEHNHEQKHKHEHENHTTEPVKRSQRAEEEHEEDNKELTAVLIQFKNPMGIVQLPRQINKDSNLMSAVPAIEVNRMFALLGVGISVLKYIGAGIMLLSAFSIFVALYNALKERKYEIALLRATGTPRIKIALLLLTEALMLGIGGVVSGILFSRLLLVVIGRYLSEDYHISIGFSGWLLPGEIFMIAAAIVITLLAAFVPAVKAGRMNISKTLANG